MFSFFFKMFRKKIQFRCEIVENFNKINWIEYSIVKIIVDRKFPENENNIELVLNNLKNSDQEIFIFQNVIWANLNYKKNGVQEDRVILASHTINSSQINMLKNKENLKDVKLYHFKIYINNTDSFFEIVIKDDGY